MAEQSVSYDFKFQTLRANEINANILSGTNVLKSLQIVYLR